MFVWGECCSPKFCILETESYNLVNTFRCKFDKGDENKISVLQAQPTQLCIMNFIGGQGWYTGHYPPGQTQKEKLINQHNLHTWHSKQMPSVPEGCASGGILSVRCNSGPAEGPGKILKYRSNLRLYPVNFSNKLCILFFINTFNLTKLIWPNFFDPPFTTENVLVPPSGNSKLFWPPSILPSPPPKY